MHFEPHATFGWAMANIAGADRRLRNYCVLGAILPDVDAVTILFGGEAYGRCHHTFGHNLFTLALFTAWVTVRCRSWKALFLSFLSFGTHLLADAKLSAWDLHLFWPFSGNGFLLPHSIGLEAPINTHLVYYSFAIVVLLALIYRRTPIDIFSPKLDQLLISFFRKKTLHCHFCARNTNQVCAGCGSPVCIHHATVQRDLSLICADCLAKRVNVKSCF